MEELLQDPRSVAVLTALIFFIVILRASLRVLPEWERAVVLRLGPVRKPSPAIMCR